MSYISDDLLCNYIDQIFLRYDRDRSGTLSSSELVYFFNDLFKMMNSPRRINQQQAAQAIREIDTNHDGQASKPELFRAFRQILNTSYQQQNYAGNGAGYGPQTNTGWGNQPGYQQGGWGNSPNQGVNQNQGWGSNQGWGNQPPNQGWGNQPQNQGWGNQPQNQGWGNQPGCNQGWGQSPQQNSSGWGNQHLNYQKNWGNTSGW